MGREASQQALEAIPRVSALSWDVVPWGLTCFLFGLGSPGRGRPQAAHPTLGQGGRPRPDLPCCGWFRVRSQEPEPRAPLCLCWAVGAGKACTEPDRGPRLCVCSERGCPGSGSRRPARAQESPRLQPSPALQWELWPSAPPCPPASASPGVGVGWGAGAEAPVSTGALRTLSTGPPSSVAAFSVF